MTTVPYEHTILRGIVGSTAYGLDRPGSDIDRLGMYVTATEKFHGLHQPVQSHVVTTPSDHTEHEVGKYLSLLLKCNPTVTELLWLPDELYEVRFPHGSQLIELRDKFLSAQAVRNAYFGYATQQFRRLSERGDGSFSADTRKRTAKHARHIKRLCWQGFTLYATGVLPIKVEDPDSYHEFGEAVARDPEHARVLMEWYENIFDLTKPVLPDAPDEDAAERWLLRVRRFYLDYAWAS